MKKILIAIIVLLLANPAFANISFTNGYWSTTFDVAAQDCNSDALSADGLTEGLCYQQSGHYTEIVTAANYSGGSGGRGLRVWYGVEKNSWSGGMSADFSTTSELWVRLYAKYNVGLTGTGEHKMLFFNDMPAGPMGSDFYRYWSQIPYHLYNSSTGYGFTSLLYADHDWHCQEYHIKSDTNGSNGVLQIWIDGINVLDVQNADIRPSYNNFLIPNNHEAFTNNPHQPVDIDDLAVATASYQGFVKDAQNRDMIGPIGWGGTDTTAPAIGTTSPSGAQTCLDAGGNDTQIYAQVLDATPPINCEFSTNSGFTYGTGTAMSPTDGGSGTNFYYDFTAQACNASYTYYMKCQDSAGTPNTSGNATISYSIDAYASDTTDPTIGSVAPSGTQTCIYDPRDMTVYAYSVADNVAVDYVKISTTNGFNPVTQGSNMTNDSGSTWSYTFSGANQLACDASYTYYVKAVDTSGNISAQSTISFSIAAQGSANLLLYEGFEDASFSSRGWYDGTPSSGAIIADGQTGNAARFTFAQSATTATNWATIRHAFAGSDEIYVRFYLRPTANWVGSSVTYHPHMLFFPSSANGAWDAFDVKHLTGYIEVGNSYNGLDLTINMQDGLDVNTSSTPPWDATGTTEDRSVTYCNGYLSTQDQGDQQLCYSVGGGLYDSWTVWRPNNNLTRDAWNLVEVYWVMNSTPGNTAVADGIMYVWVDDTLIIEKTNIVFRTGIRSSLQWDKVAISPYIGDGSPVAQSIDIDELYIYDGLVRDPPNPPPDPGTWTTRGGAGNNVRREAGTDLRWGAAE